ncbi:hypothetical protein [Lactobacillus crispatus]|jgi:hypothetical protein|uniref:Uncharacterized protein n=1 Tax=Lactobacillus crispatus TaxID=47770 RepID=A0AAW8WPB5_9LACO|nr:hypothetical protein [Lactobacillus crispatus]MCZ3784293.1 hypothetical protein [Lactobacillus crispatus]MCZ3791982.1 hypothetical protein [Lactobacillus crispatus]MDK6665158.1 hypothetical protein [Lactobacillus crispatus]MDK8612150.1 hypothetical protein [Lactobacillus crispatus]MDT9609394.1 hypothetical protein [Lactobacillus crispatus]
MRTKRKSRNSRSKAPSLFRAFGLDKGSRQDARDQSIVEYLGYRNCSKDGILDLVDGTQARYLRVHSTDLYSLDDETRSKYLDSFTTFNRIYSNDYKIVVMSTRIDTSEQQQYFRHLKNGIRSPKTRYEKMRLRLVNEMLLQSVMLSRNTEDYSDVQFYIMIFGEDLHDIRVNTRTAQFADQGLMGLRPLDYEETVKVLFRENNLNSK